MDTMDMKMNAKQPPMSNNSKPFNKHSKVMNSMYVK